MLPIRVEQKRSVSANVRHRRFLYPWFSFPSDSQDRVVDLTYPDGEVVHHDCNPQGLLESLAGADVYVENLDYNGLGQVTLMELGGTDLDLETSYGYRADNFRLQSLVTTGPGGTLQNLSYTYDDAGNVWSITDGTNGGQVQHFRYDALDRLTHAWTSGGGQGSYDHTYEYNAIGNITYRSDVGHYDYPDPGQPRPHAVTAAGGNSYAYDANGNMVTRTENGVTYQQEFDIENRLVRVINTAGEEARFLYDGDGNRVLQLHPDGTQTAYVGEYFEVTLDRAIVDDFEYTDSPLDHNWRIYAGSGTLTTVMGAGRPGRVLRASSGQGTGFGIRYPASGSLEIRRRELSVWIKDTNTFYFYVRVRATNGSDYYIRYQPTSGSPYASGSYAIVPVGTQYRDGSWRELRRDLDADLRAVFGVGVEYVQWFCVRGNYYLDDLMLIGTWETAIGETGQLDDTLTHTPRVVVLSRRYENPVVFAQPLSRDGGDTSVVRISDVQADRFTLYVDEAPGQGAGHTTEAVSYLVLEAGRWELPDGTLLEVGKTTTSAAVGNQFLNEWEQVDFSLPFSAPPIVVSQVQTENDPHWVKTRQRDTTATGFRVALEEEEDETTSHGSETVGWLATEPGQGEWNGHKYKAANTSNAVTHSWYQISFGSGAFTQAPRFIAALATYDGGDSAHLRYNRTSLTASGVQVMVEEDTTYDDETNHTTEVVSYLAIEGNGTLTGQAVIPGGQAVTKYYYAGGRRVAMRARGVVYRECLEPLRGADHLQKVVAAFRAPPAGATAHPGHAELHNQAVQSGQSYPLGVQTVQ